MIRKDLLEKIYKTDANIHDDSISLQAYRPTTYFCSAVSWWDFFPIRTVALASRVLRLLEGVMEIATSVAKQNICIYSFTRTYGEMLPAGEFIDHLKKSIRMVEEVSGPDLEKRDKKEIIQSKKDVSSCLMTLNF